MLKITTKRTEAEEEALRAEGREAANREHRDRMFAEIQATEYVTEDGWTACQAAGLQEGDVLVAFDPPRIYKRAARVTYVGNVDSSGATVQDGHVWVECESMPGQRNSGGWRLKLTDVVLREVRA